ncbi:MFS transporter [Micromonospora sp. MS34]|uniref:MFS transporter n=1 Tax=Micromonospora sp. MS34 TaxID=3385971 RepID=UPI00399F0F52
MADHPSPWLPPLGRRAWLALGVNMLSCLGSGLTMPFLIVYLHQVRGFSLPTAGMILGLVGVAGIITTPLTGPLIDRVGSLRAFTAGLLVGGVGIAIYTLATEVPVAIIAAIVYGVASGLMWNGFATLLATAVEPTERGSVFALRYMSANVAFGAGALISGFATISARPGPYVVILLADAASYVFFAVALIAMRSLLMPVGRPVAAEAEPADGSHIGYRQVLRDGALLGALLVNSLLMVFALSQTNTAFAAWVTGNGGGTTRVVGLAFFLNITVLLLAQLPAIRLARGRSRLAGAARAALFFAAAWIVLILPTTLGMPGPARDVFQVASLGVFALGEVALSPTLPALINDLAPERLRGRYNAIFSLSNQIGPVLAPALAGIALGGRFAEPYFYLLAAVCVGIGVLALLLRRITPRAADLGEPQDDDDDLSTDPAVPAGSAP